MSHGLAEQPPDALRNDRKGPQSLSETACRTGIILGGVMGAIGAILPTVVALIEVVPPDYRLDWLILMAGQAAIGLAAGVVITRKVRNNVWAFAAKWILNRRRLELVALATGALLSFLLAGLASFCLIAITLQGGP